MGQSKRDRTEALRKWNRDSIVLTEASVQIALYNLKKLVQSGVLVPDNEIPYVEIKKWNKKSK